MPYDGGEVHRQDEYLRDLVAQGLQSAIDPVVRRHWPRLTQEHQLTSRIAESIEGHLDGTMFLDHAITVLVQEMPDKGPGSLEKRTGVDLYFAVKVAGGHTNFQKGFFVQSKWDHPMSPQERVRLGEQCRMMQRKSPNGSFVWLYGNTGTSVIPAGEVLQDPSVYPDELTSRNLNEFFGDVMDCTSGDHQLVTPDVFENVDALNQMLQEFGVASGVAVTIAKDADVRPRPVKKPLRG